MRTIVHNLVVHPLLGLAQLLADLFKGVEVVMGWVHDLTAPEED